MSRSSGTGPSSTTPAQGTGITFHIGDSDTQSEKPAVTGSNVKASVDSTNDGNQETL